MNFTDDYPYYTIERSQADSLQFRHSNLEQLVVNLQLFSRYSINEVIDAHKRNVKFDDKLWRLALERMDIRNTNKSVSEETGTTSLYAETATLRFESIGGGKMK